MGAHPVRLWGAPGTGTGKWQRILRELGVDARRGTKGDGAVYRHGAPCDPDRAERHLILMRDPWGWLVSSRRDPHAPMDLRGWRELQFKQVDFACAMGGRAMVLDHYQAALEPGQWARRLSEFCGVAVPPAALADPAYLRREHWALIDPAEAAEIAGLVTRLPGTLADTPPELMAAARSATWRGLSFAVTLAGAGDLFCGLWIAQGAREAGRVPVLYARDHGGLGALFGIEVLPLDRKPPAAPFLNRNKKAEDEALGRGITRLGYQWERLGIAGAPAQPRLAAALPDVPDAAGKVLLFPASAFSHREWPGLHWRRLAHRLQGAGIPFAFCLPPSRRAEFGELPQIALHGWAQIMGAMQAARLVIANDSGPAHAAGAIGAPCLAITAMMPPLALWGHYPTVEGIHPPAYGTQASCAGCCALASRGYSKATCGQSCSEMAAISPELVLDRARKWR